MVTYFCTQLLPNTFKQGATINFFKLFFFIAIASLNFTDNKIKQNKYNSSEFFKDLYTSSLHTLVKNVNIYIQCIAPQMSAFMLTPHAVFYHYKNIFIT